MYKIFQTLKEYEAGPKVVGVWLAYSGVVSVSAEGTWNWLDESWDRLELRVNIDGRVEGLLRVNRAGVRNGGGVVRVDCGACGTGVINT